MKSCGTIFLYPLGRRICSEERTLSFRTGALLSGGERLGPTEPAGETARGPVDLGFAPTGAKRRPTPLRSSNLRVSKKNGNTVFMRVSAFSVFWKKTFLPVFYHASINKI